MNSKTDALKPFRDALDDAAISSQIRSFEGGIEILGQGGIRKDTSHSPPGASIDVEIDQAFDNVAYILARSNFDWSDVTHVDSYHVPESPEAMLLATNAVVSQLRERMPRHRPTWNCTIVPALGDSRMRVEVSVRASRPQPI